MASAHEVTLVRSDPVDGAVLAESPAQVVAQFGEELDTQGSTMIILDAAGHQVSDGDGKVDLNDPDHATMIATLAAPLAQGAYTVKWHALLTDGDASDGSFGFFVGVAGASPEMESTTTPAAASPTEARSQAAPTPLPVVATGAQPPSDAPRGSSNTSGTASGRPTLPLLWMAAAIAGAAVVLGSIAAVWRRKSG